MIDRPCRCEDCSADDRKMFGCPVSYGVPWLDGEGPGYAGQGPVYYRDGDQRSEADADEWERTCPQYYRRSPFFVSLWDELEDYRAGRVSVLGVLSSAHLTYLRVLESEETAWKNYWDGKLMPDPKR